MIRKMANEIIFHPERHWLQDHEVFHSQEPHKHTFVEMRVCSVAIPVENYIKISDILIEMWQSVVLKARMEQAARMRHP